ncbi:unnamed protein product [Medioppia subpectinata]|uniref:Vacuolar ATPase assembly integral membrane protein VMA21 homolog n=1 Tax=Medioppia subpectinata TaxID=1979941 RepID=A0A7R9L503_9ACAR|nr:unnamed protein product [Medioppia subpectinata]CAG2114556.1 unnamed protein product [Medioppia subpectinata]
MARNPLMTLVYYSIAMVTLPIAAYFLSRPVFETFTQSANIYSAIAAVVVVHIILFGFVYIAYNEDKNLTQTDKTAKSAAKTD